MERTNLTKSSEIGFVTKDIFGTSDYCLDSDLKC